MTQYRGQAKDSFATALESECFGGYSFLEMGFFRCRKSSLKSLRVGLPPLTRSYFVSLGERETWYQVSLDANADKRLKP